MKLEHWGALYALVGVVLALGLARRGVVSSPLDVALVGVAWPLYAPALLAARGRPARDAELQGLAAAIAAVQDPLWKPLLPSPSELDALDGVLRGLELRAGELAAVAARDPGSAPRLAALLRRTERERADLVDALRALRVELVALRFGDGVGEGARARVEALLATLRDAPEPEVRADDAA